MTLFDNAPGRPILRDYQSLQVNDAISKFGSNRSALLVSSVGSGKTTTFSEIVYRRKNKGRTLILAHRFELIEQIYKRLRLFGIEADIDMADQHAAHHRGYSFDVIVGTVQSVIGRLRDYAPHEFSTLIYDEAHHCTAKSYRKILSHFDSNNEIKILGVTGTPDRADEEALGQIFDTVVEPVYGIEKAIKDGWLVYPFQHLIEIEDLDLSQCRTTAGDLNGKDLADIVEQERVCQEIASATWQAVGNKRTLVFTATVKQAELTCDILNRHKEDCATWICGKTPPLERQKSFNGFESGEFQYLVNVGIVTEGTDLPFVEVIANARPTKSRALYEQIAGRCLRTLPGITDNCANAEERKIAIKNSAKSEALILDFVGNSGRHKLMTVADILGGEISDNILDEVNLRIRKKGKPANVAEEIEKLRAEMEERKRQKELAREKKRGIIGEAKFSSQIVSPFDQFDSFNYVRGWNKEAPSEAQIAFCDKRGINVRNLNKRQASAIISKKKAEESKARNGLGAAPSEKQNYVLLNKCRFSQQEIDAMPFHVWKSHLDNWFNGKFTKPKPSFTDRMIHETADDFGQAAF